MLLLLEKSPKQSHKPNQNLSKQSLNYSISATSTTADLRILLQEAPRALPRRRRQQFTCAA
jgi:hypothetical protein